MKKISAFILIILILVVTACSKKDKTLSKTDMLTSGSWTITAAMSDEDGDGIYETNDFAQFPNCYSDNFYTFRANHNLDLDEGASKCDSADPQTDSVPWQLTSNETMLEIDTESFDIVELSNSTLKIKQTSAGNISSTVTFTKR